MKSRYFFLAAVIVGAFGLLQVTLHRNHANSLVKQITAKDVAAADTAADVTTLSKYGEHHMGTGRTVVLKASYDRAVAAANDALNSSSNGEVYSQAQASCSGKSDSITQAACVQAYVDSHSSAGANPQAVPTPVLADYSRTIKSPSWTADSAGISFLIMAASFAMGVYIFLLRRF